MFDFFERGGAKTPFFFDVDMRGIVLRHGSHSHLELNNFIAILLLHSYRQEPAGELLLLFQRWSHSPENREA